METLTVVSNKKYSFLSQGYKKMSTDIIKSQKILRMNLVLINEKPFISVDSRTGLIHLNPVPLSIETGLDASGDPCNRKKYEIVEPRTAKKNIRYSLSRKEGLVYTNDFGDIIDIISCTCEHADLRNIDLHEMFIKEMKYNVGNEVEFYKDSILIDKVEYISRYSKKYPL